jgi:hypothetical protein
MPEKELICPNEAELTRYCVRCHRKLKSEASMKAGMGPVCKKRTEQEAN